MQQFVDEVIDVEERYDPYDRSIQLVPVVKQERGALRWLGDAIFNGLENFKNNIAPDIDELSRRVAERRQGRGGGLKGHQPIPGHPNRSPLMR